MVQWIWSEKKHKQLLKKFLVISCGGLLVRTVRNTSLCNEIELDMTPPLSLQTHFLMKKSQLFAPKNPNFFQPRLSTLGRAQWSVYLCSRVVCVRTYVCLLWREWRPHLLLSHCRATCFGPYVLVVVLLNGVVSEVSTLAAAKCAAFSWKLGLCSARKLQSQQSCVLERPDR